MTKPILKLYVAGLMKPSAQLIDQLESFFDEVHKDEFTMQVNNSITRPAAAREAQIFAPSALIRVSLPPPGRPIGNVQEQVKLLHTSGLQVSV